MPKPSKPYKIAFIDARCNSMYGAQQSLHTLVSNLPEDEVTPLLITTAEGVLADKYRASGVPVRIVPLGATANTFGGAVLRMGPLGKLKAMSEVVSINFRLAKLVKSEGYEIVIANESRALIYMTLGARLAHVPLVWFFRMEAPPNMYAAFRAVISNKIMMVASALRRSFPDWVQKRYGDRMVTMYTGFNLGEYKPEARAKGRQLLGLSEDDFVVGLIGSIVARKGYDVLIEAAKLVADQMPNLKLVLVGDTVAGSEDYEKQVKQLAEDPRLAGKVVWTGYVSNVPELYPAFDVGTLPSQAEGLPRVALEGLGLGVYMILSDTGGAGEIIDDPRLGEVLPDLQPATWAAALKRTYDKRAELLPNAAYRSERVRSTFTIENLCNRFVGVITEMLDKRRR